MIHQSVFIGRFQPFHRGHLEVAKNALTQSDRLLFLVGSANLGRTTRNPFTAKERANVIAEAMEDNHLLTRVDIKDLDDHPYDLQRWIGNVQYAVKDQFCVGPQPTVALTGHERDQSSFYLKKFPQWGFIDSPADKRHVVGTTIRNEFLHRGLIQTDELLSPAIQFLTKFRETPEFEYLRNQFIAEKRTLAQFGAGPHLTGDPVVIQSGHVLVVERGGELGRGKLALPGGHLDPGEILENCAVRECFEETLLFDEIADMEKRKQRLWEGFRGRQIFDDPFRSCYARVITEAFLFKLRDDIRLPVVKGRSDAKRAFWLPLVDVQPAKFFDDHAFIIQTMLKRFL